jgi:hypothetical protein
MVVSTASDVEALMCKRRLTSFTKLMQMKRNHNSEEAICIHGQQLGLMHHLLRDRAPDGSLG